MITAIRRYVVPNIFAVGMCVFASSVMAFDLGGMLKQVEKAAQQQEPNNTTTQLAKQPAQPTAQPTEQNNSQKTADATAPNSAETSEPLELKGIKIGMTAQELLKLYPQLKIKITKPQSNSWVFGDQYFYTDPQSEPGPEWSLQCKQVGSTLNNNPCTPVTIMEKQAYKMTMLFVNNKLAEASISFARYKDENKNIHFYTALIEGLTDKFKVKPTVRDTTNGDEVLFNDPNYKIVGWRNNSCECQLILFEEIYTKEIGPGFVTIKLNADEYKCVVEDRRKTLSELANKAEAQKNAKNKGDL